jgi:GntR family transcriptional regulator
VHVVPLHTRLREALVSAILTGEYAEGDRIPSERDLCDQYRVSRTTARRTLTGLVHDGWLYTVTGKGTYVGGRQLDQALRPFTGFTDDLTQRGIEVASRVLVAEDTKASADLARKLGLLPQTPVIALHRVRLAGGTPIAIQRAWLPEHRCPGLLRFDFRRRSLYEVLHAEFGLRLHRGHSVIRAGLATADERNHLGADDPSAVLRTFQTTYLEDGDAIEYCESIFHGDRYNLTFDATEREGQISITPTMTAIDQQR